VIKPLLLIITLISSVSAFGNREEFCEGFYQGYLEGWKWSSGSIFQPNIPMCPLQPRRKIRDPIDDFEFGYELGEDQGEREGRRS
jgi:hypothetical protein